ncbi:MAG: T9SS type A sorting domain-containing protein [Saprospiraceae bacterium]
MRVLFLLFSLIGSLSTSAAVCTWTGTSGTDWANPLNWSCGSVPSSGDDVVLSGQTIELNETSSINSLTISATSSILGTGTINILSNLDLADDSESTIEVEINSAGTCMIGKCELTLNQAALLIEGAGSIADQARLFLTDSGLFKIQAGAEFTVQGRLNIFGFINESTFVVEGILNKQGAGTMDFEAVYLFENATINILGGTIINYLDNGLASRSLNSTINIEAGATLAFARETNIDNTDISGGTLIVESNGTPKFDMGSTITGTSIEIETGSLFLEDGMTVPSVYQKSGQFAGDNITVIGDYLWEGGCPTGSKTIQGQTLITDLTTTSETRICNGAVLTIEGGGSCDINDRIAGIELVIPADTFFTVNAENDCIIEKITIFGTLFKTGKSDLTINSLFQFNPQGTIQGEGTIKSSFMVNKGRIQPGIDIGKLRLEASNVIVEEESTLIFEVQELSGTLSTDSLECSGDLSLDGTLVVTESGMLPDGDYPIITVQGTLSDTFATLDLPLNYSVIYGTNDVTLRKETALTDVDIVKNNISLFPNPFTEHFTIRLNKPGSHFFRLSNLNGQVVQEGQLRLESTIMDLTSAPEGVYFVTIKNKDYSFSYKLVKN